MISSTLIIHHFPRKLEDFGWRDEGGGGVGPHEISENQKPPGNPGD